MAPRAGCAPDQTAALPGARSHYGVYRDGKVCQAAPGGNDPQDRQAGVLVSRSSRWVRCSVTTGEGTTLEYIISTELVFYALMIGAVIVLRRRRPAADRPYRTIGYPVTPLIYISIAFLLVLDLAYLAPPTSGTGFLLVLSGIPVYLVRRRGAARRSSTGGP